MPYIYIKQSQFDINNVIVKINNENLILNYNICDAKIKLKNIIFNLEDHILLTKIIDTGEEDGDYKNHLRIVLKKDILDILNTIDAKINAYVVNTCKYEYLPIVNKEAGYSYINIYINNYVNMTEKKNINTYLLLKFKLINNKYIPRMYTYNMIIN